MTTTLLLAGVSVRAFAESAAAAGFSVVAVDAFGDLDLRAVATVHALPGAYSAHAAALRARGVTAQACAYTSNFENHPTAINALAAGRTLLGNRPDVLRCVRNPFVLARAFAKHGVRVPTVLATAPRGEGRWLIKPRRSGGGHGVSEWRDGAPLPRHCVVQERISGTPGSIVFAANGHAVRPLAFTHQLIRPDFRYGGNILVPRIDAAVRLAEIATYEFGLVGVNGIDFVLHHGEPIPIEVNPRYTAAMELAERRYGISIARTHVDACAGTLGDVELEESGPTIGKAIVYAKRATVVGDMMAWLDDPSIRDVPPPGTRVERGRPICTVFAEGCTVAECAAALEQRVDRLA